MPFKILHCGCASAPLPPILANLPDIQEIRLDINPGERPDIVASVTNIPLEPGCVDCVYSSHLIEHLYAHQVDKAIYEFFRVLNVGGQLLLRCPDLEQVCKFVLEGKMDEAVYTLPHAGPITAGMMMFGYTPDIAKGNLYMCHHYGFTANSLGNRLHRAGFWKVTVVIEEMDLVALAVKGDGIYETTY